MTDEPTEDALLAAIHGQWRVRLPHEPCTDVAPHEGHQWGRPRTDRSRWCEGVPGEQARG